MADITQEAPRVGGGWLRAVVLLMVLGLGGLVIAGVVQEWSGVGAVAAVAAAWELALLFWMRARWKPQAMTGDPAAPLKAGHRGWMTVVAALAVLYGRGFYFSWRMHGLWENRTIPDFGLPRVVVGLVVVLGILVVLTGGEALVDRVFRWGDHRRAQARKPPLVLGGP